MRVTAEGVELGLLEPDDITEELLERCLYTDSSSVDLLIRTSGEVRFSDFLLWQSCHSVVYFTPVLWPDFSVRDLLAAVFHYQRRRWGWDGGGGGGGAKREEGINEGETDEKRTARVTCFLRWLETERERRKCGWEEEPQ